MITLLYAVIVSAASMWAAASVDRMMHPPAQQCPAPKPPKTMDV